MLRPRPEKRRLRRDQRAAALLVSVIGHAALCLFFLAAGSNGGELLSGDGLGDVQAMEVSLVGGQAEAEPSKPLVSNPAAELLGRLGADQPQPSLAPNTLAYTESLERASLDELLNEATSSKAGSASGRPEGQDARTREGAKDGKGTESGGARRAAGGAAGNGGLWSIIEPCWRRQNVPLNAHARLVVELDLLGRLTSPPKVVRANNKTLDRDQLLAEARAFDALTACLPDARGRFRGEHVLDFRRD